MTSIISGFALSMTRVEAQAIHTSAAGLVAGKVQIPVADEHLPAYSARPTGDGPFPTGNYGDAERLGITGFSRGGRQTILYAAHNPKLRAAVAWYGLLDVKTSAIQPQTALSVIDDVLCPVLGLYGSEERRIRWIS